MARPTARLVVALRETATGLRCPGAVYRWSHFAHCNCGHLAQTVTHLDPKAIQRAASFREGDWGQQARQHAFELPDYGDRPALDEGAWEPDNVGACRVTGTPLDTVLDQMFELGLEPEDVEHLERLSDPEVRQRLGASTIDFLHYERDNVVRYLEAWAELLEEQLPENERAESFALAAE